MGERNKGERKNLIEAFEAFTRRVDGEISEMMKNLRCELAMRRYDFTDLALIFGFLQNLKLHMVQAYNIISHLKVKYHGASCGSASKVEEDT